MIAAAGGVAKFEMINREKENMTRAKYDTRQVGISFSLTGLSTIYISTQKHIRAILSDLQ